MISWLYSWNTNPLYNIKTHKVNKKKRAFSSQKSAQKVPKGFVSEIENHNWNNIRIEIIRRNLEEFFGFIIFWWGGWVLSCAHNFYIFTKTDAFMLFANHRFMFSYIWKDLPSILCILLCCGDIWKKGSKASNHTNT